MEGIKPELVSLLIYLLPGFVAMWIYHRLISLPRPSSFECVVEALIFTAIVHLTISATKLLAFWIGSAYSLGEWNLDAEKVLAYLFASLFGVIAVKIGSNDEILFAKLRKMRLTNQSAYPNDWFSAFKRHLDSYVVLHLSDGRRLYGWPAEWPSSSDIGHICVSSARWLPSAEGQDEVSLERVSSLLIKATDVRWVEFVQPVKGDDCAERISSSGQRSASERVCESASSNTTTRSGAATPAPAPAPTPGA